MVRMVPCPYGSAPARVLRCTAWRPPGARRDLRGQGWWPPAPARVQPGGGTCTLPCVVHQRCPCGPCPCPCTVLQSLEASKGQGGAGRPPAPARVQPGGGLWVLLHSCGAPVGGLHSAAGRQVGRPHPSAQLRPLCTSLQGRPPLYSLLNSSVPEDFAGAGVLQCAPCLGLLCPHESLAGGSTWGARC